MAIKQLSVFVDNKKGALSDITSFLAKQGIDLRAMSIADTQDFGILRLIVNDTERAAALLRETEAIAKVTDVIAVALKNVYDRREQITRGVRITWEAPLMRHFTVQLERL